MPLKSSCRSEGLGLGVHGRSPQIRWAQVTSGHMKVICLHRSSAFACNYTATILLYIYCLAHVHIMRARKRDKPQRLFRMISVPHSDFRAQGKFDAIRCSCTKTQKSVLKCMASHTVTSESIIRPDRVQ